MVSLVTLDDITARYDAELDEGEERMVVGVLESLSNDARYYSGQSWDSPEDAPPRVLSLIIGATIRYLRNPDGASQSRAGDETLMWENRRSEKAGWAYFTDDEIADLKNLGGTSGKAFGTIATWSWTQGGGRRDLTIGTTPPGADPFPWVSKDDEVYW